MFVDDTCRNCESLDRRAKAACIATDKCWFHVQCQTTPLKNSAICLQESFFWIYLVSIGMCVKADFYVPSQKHGCLLKSILYGLFVLFTHFKRLETAQFSLESDHIGNSITSIASNNSSDIDTCLIIIERSMWVIGCSKYFNSMHCLS